MAYALVHITNSLSQHIQNVSTFDWSTRCALWVLNTRVSSHFYLSVGYRWWTHVHFYIHSNKYLDDTKIPIRHACVFTCSEVIIVFQSRLTEVRKCPFVNTAFSYLFSVLLFSHHMPYYHAARAERTPPTSGVMTGNNIPTKILTWKYVNIFFCAFITPLHIVSECSRSVSHDESRSMCVFVCARSYKRTRRGWTEWRRRLS